MSTGRPTGVWWLSPIGAVSLVVPATLWIGAATSDKQFRFAWGSPKALTTSDALLFASGALVLVIAACLPLLRRDRAPTGRWPALTTSDVALLRRAATPLFWITMAGYLAFLLSGLRNGLTPDLVLRALFEQDVYAGTLKTILVSVPGLTTLTQVGTAFVVVASLLLTQGVDAVLVRRLVVLLVLALLRASLLAERLAVLELAIPATAVLVLSQVQSGSVARRRLVRLAPALLVPLVLVAFGSFEYSRSWVFYSQHTSVSFPRFTVERLAGYYATAYNNGSLALEHERYTGRLPYGSVEAVWTAPGADLLGGYPAPDGRSPTDDHTRTLELYGNPEFNSPGGLAIPFVDWGVPGGLLFFALIGTVLGLLHRACLQSGKAALVLYPAMTTGLFELPRYVYWSLGRFTPSLVALCVVGFLLVRRSRATSDREGRSA